jgi:hypothetical protein
MVLMRVKGRCDCLETASRGGAPGKGVRQGVFIGMRERVTTLRTLPRDSCYRFGHETRCRYSLTHSNRPHAGIRYEPLDNSSIKPVAATTVPVTTLRTTG